jgi:hypothetical protein
MPVAFITENQCSLQRTAFSALWVNQIRCLGHGDLQVLCTQNGAIADNLIFSAGYLPCGEYESGSLPERCPDATRHQHGIANACAGDVVYDDADAAVRQLSGSGLDGIQ